ncbi:hypothetical protein PN498_18200 [Oscillatoria sp. CS-180]|uniref:hypothetical protein n=1 Tax=Oscillatoria sp. CS-180 TaxID=3021720 RepID=UPI0023309584|nr:hypothetical protein [Oscillatoria sp. CS-180]MDB9527931.1 hypothetical protein [Oscillatoria sp. CS-180]
MAKSRSPWVSTKQLAEELGCSQKFIRETLKDELFKKNQHYRNINPSAWRPTYRWHLKKCLDSFQENEVEKLRQHYPAG